MLKKSFLIIVSLFCSVGLAKADMYAVSNIHVDVTAQNATIAREQGLNDAQEKAFYKMLDRLTLFKDMEALPVLTSEDILKLRAIFFFNLLSSKLQNNLESKPKEVISSVFHTGGTSGDVYF